MSRFFLFLFLFADLLYSSNQPMRVVGFHSEQGPQSGDNSKRVTPEEIWKGIKAAAQEEVRQSSPLISYPKFNSKQKGSSSVELTIIKGSVDNLGFGNDPYELPFKKQILIEALRQALLDSGLSQSQAPVNSVNVMTASEFDQSWQEHLAQAENLVKEAVVQIESEADREKLDAKLSELGNRIDEILYTRIYGVVESFAESRQYNILSGRGADRVKKFSVIITTVPEGARVFMMTDLLYRKQLLKKTDPSQWPWIEIVQSPYELLGKYRYLTVWPDGKKVEDSINVANSSPLRLQRD